MSINIINERIEFGSLFYIYGPANVTYLDLNWNVCNEYIQEEFSNSIAFTDLIYEFDNPKEIISDTESYWNDLLKILHSNMSDFIAEKNKLFDKITNGGNDQSEYIAVYYNEPWIWHNNKINSFFINQSFTVMRVDYD